MTHTPSAANSNLSSTHAQDKQGVPEVLLVDQSGGVAQERKTNGVPKTAKEPAAGEDVLVDQGGRPLGPRALQTRSKILEATVELLDQKPLRDLRVIDIARRIGSSPATFYQYFKDVEDVILHLASEVSEFTPEIVELIKGDWSGADGHARGRRVAEVVINHWDRFAPILRVRNNASDEGDQRFRDVRMQAMMPMVDAFSALIRTSHEAARAEANESDEWSGGRLDPMYGAMALTSVLERLSMYHVSLEEMGGAREDLVETVGTLLQTLLTSKR
ncbi:MAG: TetR/AcrR family transcriptional regulator [Myxococcota bacterium]